MVLAQAAADDSSVDHPAVLLADVVEGRRASAQPLSLIPATATGSDLNN